MKFNKSYTKYLIPVENRRIPFEILIICKRILIYPIEILIYPIQNLTIPTISQGSKVRVFPGLGPQRPGLHVLWNSGLDGEVQNLKSRVVKFLGAELEALPPLLGCRESAYHAISSTVLFTYSSKGTQGRRATTWRIAALDTRRKGRR